MILPPINEKRPLSPKNENPREALLTFFQVWLRGLDQEEGTLDVDEEMIIKVLLVDLAQRLQSCDPSVQNRNADPSERLEGLA